MRRWLAILAVLVACVNPVAGLAREVQPGLSDGEAGIVLVRLGRYAQAIDRLSTALSSPLLTRNERGEIHLWRGSAFWHLGDQETARADFDQAVELLVDPNEALVLRARLAWWTGDRNQSLQDVMRLAHEFPQHVSDVNLVIVWGLWRWLREEERPDDQLALIESLLGADYRPFGFQINADGLRQEYIGVLIESGKIDHVWPYLKRMKDTRSLLRMRINRRFEVLWDHPEFEARSEPLAAAQRELAYWRAMTKKRPRNLRIVLQHMDTLRMLGDSQAAVAIGEQVLADFDRYEDDEEYRLWVLNEQAYALVELGRAEEAAALMNPLLERSAKNGDSIVNQFINYGNILMAMGRHEAALEAVEKAKGKVSPYGRKWIESTQACASHRLGRDAAAEAALERLKIRPEENYSALIRALACLNRLDEAAEAALAKLRDPIFRETMLLNLQQWREPRNRLPLDAEMKRRFEAIYSRPEVKAEAEKFGRILKIPLYSTYWGDF